MSFTCDALTLHGRSAHVERPPSARIHRTEHGERRHGVEDPGVGGAPLNREPRRRRPAHRPPKPTNGPHAGPRRSVDFPALRTTFSSWLGMTGVHPRTAQALARHASIETTLGTYTDLRLFDATRTVANLPPPGTARPAPSARRRGARHAPSAPRRHLCLSIPPPAPPSSVPSLHAPALGRRGGGLRPGGSRHATKARKPALVGELRQSTCGAGEGT